MTKKEIKKLLKAIELRCLTLSSNYQTLPQGEIRDKKVISELCFIHDAVYTLRKDL